MEYECLALERKENKSNEVDSVIEQLKELSCSVLTSSANIKAFDGKNMKVEEFLKQF